MNLTQLHSTYYSGRSVNLNEDEFSILVNLYPVVLVAMADGTFNEAERSYVADVCVSTAFEHHANDNQAEAMAEALFEELILLVKNPSAFKKDFLQLLSSAMTEDDKANLQILLEEVAQVTHGTSEVELNAIHEIMSTIHLTK